MPNRDTCLRRQLVAAATLLAAAALTLLAACSTLPSNAGEAPTQTASAASARPLTLDPTTAEPTAAEPTAAPNGTTAPPVVQGDTQQTEAPAPSPPTSAQTTRPVVGEASDVPEPVTTESDDGTPQEPVIDRTRRAVRSTTEWLARGVDSWFGDQPFEQGGKVKDGRLSLNLLKRQHEDLDPNVRFSVRLRLPNLERRSAYLFFGRDNEQEAVTDKPGPLSRQDRLLVERPEDRSFFAGLGLALLDVFDVRAGFRGIRPYAQARYRKQWNLSEQDLVEFRHTFFWKLHERFGATTALSYEHAYSSSVALRAITAFTVTQQSKVYDWSNLVGAYKGFSDQRLLSLELVANGSQHRPVAFSEYGVQTKWLQPIYHDWLFAEFMVGHFWPYNEDLRERMRVWAVGLNLTMKF